MRALPAVAVAVTLMILMVDARPSAAEGRYWVGQLKVAEFNFAKNTAEPPSSDAGRQWESADLTTYIYQVSQNPSGMVRHELTSMSRRRGLEPGLDIQLLNYAEGYMVSFNKGAKAAPKTRMPLPGGVSTPLEDRQILGHMCRGSSTKWSNLKQYVMLVQTWTPSDCNFRDPLLKTTTVSDRSGRLWRITIEVITDLEQTGHLDGTLFRVPPTSNSGLQR